MGGGKDDGPIENKIRESSGHFGVDELQGESDKASTPHYSLCCFYIKHQWS